MMKPPEPRRTDIHRGEVWRVDFDPTIGVEMNKKRPAVVISPDDMGVLPLRVVVPITDWKPRYTRYIWFTHLPETPANGLTKESGADAIQLKSISETRFIEKLGVLTPEQIEQITASIALCIGFTL